MIKRHVLLCCVILMMLTVLFSGCVRESGSNSMVEVEEENRGDKDLYFDIPSEILYFPPSELNDGSQAAFGGLSYEAGSIPSVVYMPPGTEFDYYMGIGEGIRTYAEALGITMSMEAPVSGADIEGQIQRIQDVLKDDVDIIILSTHDENALAPYIQQAVDQGVEVIIVNSDILEFPTPVHGVVGYDQRKGTSKMGAYAAAVIGDTETVVGIIEGQPGWHSSQRVGGFLDVIEPMDTVRIAARADGRWNVAGGKEAAERMLKDHPDIQLIFAANDYEIIGASQAIEALDLDDILLFGNDGDTACLEAIEAGRIDATLNTDPFQMGRIALQVALDGLVGRFDGGYVETPTVIVDRENVMDYLQNPETLYPKPSKSY